MSSFLLETAVHKTFESIVSWQKNHPPLDPWLAGPWSSPNGMGTRGSGVSPRVCHFSKELRASLTRQKLQHEQGYQVGSHTAGCLPEEGLQLHREKACNSSTAAPGRSTCAPTCRYGYSCQTGLPENPQTQVHHLVHWSCHRVTSTPMHSSPPNHAKILEKGSVDSSL